MSQYFDRDFFKFFLGFTAIISVSLMAVIATKLYVERNNNVNEAPSTANTTSG